MTYHPVVQTIITILTEHNVWFETFEHEEVRTSEEAAKTRPGYTLAQGAKALIVRIKKAGSEKQFAMIVLPGDQRFETAKAKVALRAKDIRFATSEEVAEVTQGVLPGGVPPFGNVFGLQVFADASLFANKKIVFNAGDRRFSIGMYAADYKHLVQPEIVDVLAG